MTALHPRRQQHPAPAPVHVRARCDRCRMRLAHRNAPDAQQCPRCPATVSGSAAALAFLAASRPEPAP